LRDDTTDARQISAPETSREELFAEAMSRPVEDKLTEWRRKAAEREQRIAARRSARDTTTAQAMARLEALEEKLARMKAEQSEHVLSAIEEALGIFDEEISAPLAAQVAALSEKITTLEATVKRLGGDVSPIDLPNVLDARRMQ
jgi:chromosome segregation ATPase